MAEEKEKYPWDEEKPEEEETEESTGAKIISWIKTHKKFVAVTAVAGAGAIFLWRVIKSIPDTPDAGNELTDTLNDPYDPFADVKGIKDAAPKASDADILAMNKKLADLEIKYAAIKDAAPKVSDADILATNKKLADLEIKYDTLCKRAMSSPSVSPMPLDTKTYYRHKYPNIPEGYTLKGIDNPLSKAYWISDNVLNVVSDRDMALSLDTDQAMRKASEMMSEVIKSGIDLNDVALMQLMVDLKDQY